MFCYWFSFEWQRRVRKQDTAQNENSDYCFNICCITWVKLMVLGRNAKSKRMLQSRVQWPSHLEIFPGISCKKIERENWNVQIHPLVSLQDLCIYRIIGPGPRGCAGVIAAPIVPLVPVAVLVAMAAGRPPRPTGGGVKSLGDSGYVHNQIAVGNERGKYHEALRFGFQKKINGKRRFILENHDYRKKSIVRECTKILISKTSHNRCFKQFTTLRKTNTLYTGTWASKMSKKKESEKHDIRACIVFSVCWTYSLAIIIRKCFCVNFLE